ncbi:hypothetical protein, variant [Sphaeroforma arctica JP610]|uniref:Kinetochore protein NDC80 n=1 Tax=Sphaeroforma arctica JP610 TaxID=667725 RepID=A0A0L0FU79_9EUKA|nr:hypothetical protein, variant [Sphaeroforma arctica JP610]KNC80219.1 hypothetical protein, variant [Sphaeroforma arctica JP610]|eukprot:XP_014154121.1 hypothetical protein, variant [Sphaeroforma arctica JP610]
MNRSGLKTVSDSQANSMNGRMSMGVQRGPRKPDAASRRSMIPVAPSRGLAYSNSNASQESYRDSGSSHAGYARQSMATGRRRSATRGEIQPPKKDRRSTGFGHHQSSMAMSRRSSIYGERSANKDTRPLSDKEYRKQCCAHMFRYLTTNGYSHPISIKLLTQPMMKDFLRIFQFLYTQLDNGYKFPENNTERTIPEVIILMKGVRYPFVLKQSSLLAFTPMEWPSLLGALHWLVELCQYNEGIGPAPYFYSVSEFDEGVPRDAQAQHVFEYVSKAYASFMLGTGDDDDDDGTDLTLFSRRKDSLLERKQQIDQSIDRLKNESVRYTQGPTPLQEATQMKADCESDMRKFVRVIQDYERKLMSRQKKLAEKTALVEQARKEAAQLQAESSHLNNVLANQELSPTDVLRINMDRAHLKKSLEDAQKQKEDSDMKLFEREKEITLATQEIHRKIYAYHELAGSIGVVPSSAKVCVCD